MTNPKKGRIQETHQEYALKLIELLRAFKKSTVKIMREVRGGRDLVGTLASQTMSDFIKMLKLRSEREYTQVYFFIFGNS